MKAISFTGHRTQALELTKFSKNEIWEKLYITIEKLIVEKGAEVFISGGAIGIDQMAFMCVHWLKKKYPHIKNIMAIPFEKQPDRWRKVDKERYKEMKKIADELVYVDTLEDYQPKRKNTVGEYDGAKMQLRNMYMVDKTDIVVAVYNGEQEGGTFNCIQYAKKKKKQILCIDLLDELKYKTL